jgi:hypothetical protein
MGKFGIILAFLLSVAAAGGSYYLYQGWIEERAVRGSVEAKYDQVKEKMITVQSEKEQIKAEKEKITAKSEEYRNTAEAMQAQLEKLQTAQSRIDSEKAALKNQLKSHQTMIAELQAKMAELEKKAKDAQAACGVTPADLKTDPFSAAPSFPDTAASVTSPSTAPEASTFVPSPSAADALADGTSQLVFKPVTLGSSVSSVSPESPMPPVVKDESVIAAAPDPVSPAVEPAEPVQSSEVSATEGAAAGAKVLTVNRKFNFVVINQGLQEGLKMGDKLKVYKQDNEVASVQIEKLYDKFSAATLVEEDPKQQVVEGDEVRRA